MLHFRFNYQLQIYFLNSLKILRNNFCILCLIYILLIIESCDKATNSINPDLQIIVDFGKFKTSEQAANAEYKIDWSGTDIVSMNACTENYAVQELRKFLCELTKSDFGDPSIFRIAPFKNKLSKNSIVVCNVSMANSSPQVAEIIQKKNLIQKLTDAENFAIIPEGDKIFIIGQTRIGTLYGIYFFLESYGVRWYEPGNLGQVIPVKKKLPMPKKMIVEKPDFFTRGFWVTENRGNRDFYIWMARNRFNLWSIEEPNRAFLRKLGIQLTVGGHSHFDRFLNPNEQYPFHHPKYSGDKNKPQDPYRTDSKEYLGDANGDGVLTYFEAHPEWYGLVKGKRCTFNGDFGTNICTSNKDAVAELCRKLINELADGEWRDATSLNFWPIDRGNWCECDNCKHLGTPTDRLLLLIHLVRKSIVQATDEGRINRNIKVIFPIYIETLSPPSKPLPKNFDYDNCIGTFFPIRRCYNHFIDDSSCTEFNSRIWYAFSLWTKNKFNYYKGQYFVGEYYNISTTKSLPVLYTRIMKHDIPLYYNHGVRHFHYMHVYTDLLGMKRINNYLLAKLLWDFQADVKFLLKEYFHNYYGKADKQMARLYDYLEYAMSSVKQWKHSNPLTTRINNNREPLFHLFHLRLKKYHPKSNDGVDLEESVDALKKCRKIMDKVLSDDWSPLIKQRLLEDDKNLQYAENTVNFYYYFAQAIQAKNKGTIEQSKRFYKASIPFAQGLKAETDIVQTASSFANSENGLKATLVEKTYLDLGKELNMNY